MMLGKILSVLAKLLPLTGGVLGFISKLPLKVLLPVLKKAGGEKLQGLFGRWAPLVSGVLSVAALLAMTFGQAPLASILSALGQMLGASALSPDQAQAIASIIALLAGWLFVGGAATKVENNQLEKKVAKQPDARDAFLELLTLYTNNDVPGKREPLPLNVAIGMAREKLRVATKSNISPFALVASEKKRYGQ
jgi:hypothetical protein